MIKFEDVLSVYSGKDGVCCCGCAGKHFYREDLRAEGGLRRGYAVSEDECSTRMVKRVVNKLNSGKWEIDGAGTDCQSIVVGARIYVVYLRPNLAAKAVELGLAPNAPAEVIWDAAQEAKK